MPGAVQKAAPERPSRPAAPAGPRVSFIQMVFVGALVGVLGRALLVFPADLFARLLGSVGKEPGPDGRGWVELWNLVFLAGSSDRAMRSRHC